MRPLSAILTLLAFAVPAFAQDQAELARLRDENAQLRQQLADIAASFAEAKKLHGTWIIETARRDGKVVASDQGGELEFLGNVVLARMPGQKELHRLEFGIHPATRQVDFRPLLLGQGYKATGTSLDLVSGRYEWAGDTLRVSLQSAYTIPKDVSDREQVLWVLKRKP